jgi:hypothetical protein
MKVRIAAWLICVVCAVLAGLALVLGVLNGRTLASLLTDAAPSAILAVSFSLVGALVVTRQPRNPLGWIFGVIGLSQGLVSFAYEYGVYALWTTPGSLPGGSLLAWLANWVWAPGLPVLVTFLLLLFPDGQLPSPRWRPVAWLSATAIVLIGASSAILYWPLRGPVLVEPGDRSGPAVEGPLTVVQGGAIWLLLLCGIASMTALSLRFYRARGVERQQLKWFVFAGAVTGVGYLVGDQLAAHDVELGVAGVLFIALSLAIPIAVGIAILKYRLYDIDRLINRTLVYGLLTAVLGLGYAGAVLILGQISGRVTQQPPSWAVAGATLAVAALFQPARRRIQAAVDKRFNRSRYNAAKTIEAFSARLRDEIDLDTLSAELLAVVDQTMEPTTASLWLRPSMERAWRPSPVDS